jgi:hypothetical protein
VDTKSDDLGPLSALGVGAYIALAGLWSSPISGASMNPARSFGTDLVLGNFAHYWVYVVGPILGAVIAVGIAFILRGRADVGGAAAAQGALGRSGWDPTQVLRGVLTAPDATPALLGCPAGPSIQIRGTQTHPGRCRADGDEGSAKDSEEGSASERRRPQSAGTGGARPGAAVQPRRLGPLPISRYKEHGERVVYGQRMMQAASWLIRGRRR